MKHCKLRIAWSVGWGVVAVMLIALWVRSHFAQDWWYVSLFNHQNLELTQQNGCLSLTLFQTSGPLDLKSHSWTFPENTLFKNSRAFGEMRVNKAGFGDVWFPRSKRIVFPFWLPVAVLALLGTAPWLRHIRWRFRLRTLIITMTIVAAVLGLLAWLAAK
jgi:hypothetical protein